MTIQQSETFEGVRPDELFDAYLDGRRHAHLVGAPASITDRVGAPFWVFAEGAVRGSTLYLVPGKLIVQRWRATVFADSDPDSVLTLAFAPDGPAATRLDLVQVHVPDAVAETIADGWRTNYWQPWRRHLTAVGTAGSLG